jgi:hypothetical protein
MVEAVALSLKAFGARRTSKRQGGLEAGWHGGTISAAQIGFNLLPLTANFSIVP